jgi:hypothetical protein
VNAICRQSVTIVLAGCAAVVLVGCAVLLVAACGGSAGGTSPQASAVSSSPAAMGPTPVPSPRITSGALPAGAVRVVHRYWDLMGAHEYDAAFALTTGPHMYNAAAGPKEFESVRYLRAATSALPRPGNDATVEFGSWVYIVPTATSSPFGTTAARWEMFSRVVRMSDGSWRLVEVGTGE